MPFFYLTLQPRFTINMEMTRERISFTSDPNLNPNEGSLKNSDLVLMFVHTSLIFMVNA